MQYYQNNSVVSFQNVLEYFANAWLAVVVGSDWLIGKLYRERATEEDSVQGDLETIVRFFFDGELSHSL